MEIWVLLLEKAFAKFVGTYVALEGGDSAWAWQALTGGTELAMFKKNEMMWTEFLNDIEKQRESVSKKEAEVLNEKKKMPHNVDTLSSAGFSKTIVNKTEKPKYEDLSEEEREKRMKKFVKENEKLMKEYGMLQKFDDSKKFLMDGRTHLASEETANYLVLWCLDLEMEGKHDLMTHVAHQCICMQYLIELAKQTLERPVATGQESRED